ncbi:MAG: hybrid sensor histidine kinase/response regulator [Lachnospiraceae bacterium]|nr:hybrid sensor histidine kinase/response regulator [Lachnospiraceae bacterium]
MNRRTNNQFAILVISVIGIGLVIESYMLGWEFWVPPLMILGIIGCWILHIANKSSEDMREIIYFSFASLIALYLGVHRSSIFEVSIIAMLLLVTFAVMNRKIFLTVFLFEYLILLLIQIVMAVRNTDYVFDPLNLFKILMVFMGVVLLYLNCIRSIQERIDLEELNKAKDNKIEAYDEDMEDFLSNISHELRTPVNVVMGMSDIMLEGNDSEEVLSIRQAGFRLSHQIEDIQDYTESKRKKLILEEDDYMSTALINDVVRYFRSIQKDKNLELVVNMSPNLPMKMKGDIKKLHKIFRHILENAVKFTQKGGVYISLSAEETPYGVNLCIEIIDTGEGMERKTIALAADTMYQRNRKRNRSSGGIGLGLSIVYGLTHKMGGFVRIESEPGSGTTVRVTIPQKVVDKSPCLRVNKEFNNAVLLHVRQDKYKVARIRDFYRTMVETVASEAGILLYSTETASDIKRMINENSVSHIFMGEEEYLENADYFDELSRRELIVVVATEEGFIPNKESRVLFISKPLYTYSIIRILNEGKNAKEAGLMDRKKRLILNGIRALVVDDEPMNLFVATGLFKKYGMVVETALDGMESIDKFRQADYDIIFMDHMMPGMDGVETMHRIRELSKELSKQVIIVAFTTNMLSGAREMFVREGFDGFIAKPIDLNDFERVMLQVLPEGKALLEV